MGEGTGSYPTDTVQPDGVDRRNFLRGSIAFGTLLAIEGVSACSNGGSQVEAPDGTTTTTDTSEPSVPSSTETTAPEVQVGQEVLWQWDPSMPLDAQWNIATPAYQTYNNEKQIYMNRPENVRVEDGILILEARQEGGELSSGLVSTEGMASFGVGSRFEASLRLPKGAGTWPAFWLLSESQPFTQGLTDEEWETPIENSAGEERERYLENGEIDIMEFYGQIPGTVEGTVHTVETSKEGHLTIPDASETFHTYALEWHEDALIWSVDGNTYFTFPKPANDSHSWPFAGDNQMFIILNLAMGGDGGGEIVSKPDDRWRMEVASVKVTKLTA